MIVEGLFGFLAVETFFFFWLVSTMFVTLLSIGDVWV